MAEKVNETVKIPNIFAKLAAMRVELQNAGINKSGYNDYSKYSYYELSDFLPVINKIALEHGVFNFYELLEGKAVLHVMDFETKEQIDFEIPIAELSMKGANAIQNVGGLTTYTRRYLYMIAYEVAENDEFDPQENNQPVEEKAENVLISEVHILTLKSVLEKKGVEEEKILDRYGKDKIENLTMEDFMKAMKALEKTPDLQAQNVDLGFN